MELQGNFPIEKLRQETPGCEQVIHLNNAGAGLMPTPVLTAMQEYLQLEAEIGGYEAAEAQQEVIQDFYQQMAKFLSCHTRNIAVAASSTDAYAKALSSIPFQAGDVILTTQNDYSSNQLAFLSLEKRLGVRLVFAPDRPEGGVDTEIMEHLMDENSPVLVAVTHIPTNSGLIQPIEEIGKLCRERNILYLVDACQSVGQTPVNCQEIGCDFLTASYRKFLRGPRGLGFLYVSDRVLGGGMEPLFIDLRGSHWKEATTYFPKPDAMRFEFWEQPFALVVGAQVCVKYALDLGLENIQDRTYALAAHLRKGLANIPGIRVLDEGDALCGITTSHLPGRSPEEIGAILKQHRINYSVAYRENAVRDFDRKGVKWALRLSPHYYNTKEEVVEVWGE